MANVIRGNYFNLRSSDTEMVVKIFSEFERAMDADTRNRDRSYENWQAYIAIDGGQYPPWLRNDLNNEERHADQYNIIGPKVDTLAGALSSEKFDLALKPRDGIANPMTKAAETSWMADRDTCHYDRAYNNVLRNGCVFNGDLKMQMSQRFDPKTNICFTEVQPGFLIRDPHWISDDDRDCEQAWEIFHLTALQVKQKYPNAGGPRLEEEIRRMRMFGGDYQDDDPDFNAQIRMSFKGHLFRVIEYHWIETIQTTRWIGQKLGSEKWLPFPITKDDDVLEAYMIQNDIDPHTLTETPYNDKIHWFATIAPDLVPNKLLEHRVSVVQPGRLPYYHFTANRAFGKDKGIVDDIIDLQRTLNYREMKLTEMISTAGGGGKVVSEDLFDTPEKRSEFEQNIADPKYVHWASGDEMAGGQGQYIHYLNQNTFNSQIVDQIARMWDVVDRISKVPAAMDAMSESANESGVLFDRKLQVARMGIVTLIDRVKEFRKNIFEGYVAQWQLAYNGIERRMATADGKFSVTLNKKIYNANDGKIYIQNRPAQLPRCVVTISESAANPTKLMRLRGLYSELYDRAVQTNPEQASVWYEGLVSTMKDDMSEEMQAKLAVSTRMQAIRDMKRLETEIATLDATQKQAMLADITAMMQIQQLTAGNQPQEIEGGAVPEDEIPQPVRREVPQEQAQPQNLLTGV